MKNALILLLCCAFFSAQAQDVLHFSTRLIDCEDKWIALPITKDSTYNYGFIYLDNMAGLSLRVEGSFKIGKDKLFIPKKLSLGSNLIQRIPQTKMLVSIIPESKFSELEITKLPHWLSIYKTDNNNIYRLFRLGFVYNQWDEAEKALIYLEQVKKINPNYGGLAFEFAFAYNVLKEYDKASAVLKEAIKKNPKDCLLYKELVYSQLNGKLSEAENTFKLADKECLNNEYKGEMAHNIAYHYYILKNKIKFNYWAEQVVKYTKPTDMFAQKLKLMQVEMEKL